jgi:acyl carrier protein
MATNLEKVTAFLSSASDLLKTSKRMEDIFNMTMKRNEKKVAVQYINSKGKIKKYRYNKMRSHTYELASALSQYLIQQPKNVPIILKVANSPHWGEMFWAILMCGYKPLLIDARTSKDGAIHVAEMSKALAIITDDANQYPFMKISISDLVEEKHHYSFTPEWENEVIFSSSGTTGDVKLMVFNGENLCNQICCSLEMGQETADIMYPDKMGKVKILAMIPFHHIFGFVAVFLWYTFYGKTIVFPSSNAPSDIQSICQKVGITHVYSVPLFWDSLALGLSRKAALEGPQKQEILDKMIGYNTGKIDKAQAGIAASKVARDTVQKKLLGNKVKFCISGGGFLSRETLTQINGIGYNLYDGYGMTEIGVTSVELSPNVEDRLKGRIGRPLHGVTYKIDTKEKPGELMVKSPTVHIREIINGVEGPATLTEDGFFRTGDIAETDATGGYYLKGRIKDIIINADGENIFPDELEIYFKELPLVQQLCVLGYSPEHNNIEKIALVLELDNKAKEEDVENIKNQIKEIVPNLPHKVKIDGVFLSRGKLPLANNMKVKRFVIKKALEENSKDYLPIDGKKKAKSFEGFDPKDIEAILIPMREIFSKVLILPTFKIEDDAHWINDLGGDSMSYVELIRDVQEKFGVEFPEELLGQMATINDFVYEVAKLQKGSSKGKGKNNSK